MMRETIPADELLAKVHTIGQYYGFTPLSTLTAKSRGSARAAPVVEPALPTALDPVAEMMLSFLRRYRHLPQPPIPHQPLFVWHTNLAPGRVAQKRVNVQFHAIGTDHAIADTVIIRAIVALARDLFHEEPVVRINSMGDKETRARYARELGVFFKKRSADLPEECVTRAKCSAFEAAELMIERECADDLPAPTEHLSDASRKRFEDLLEYLEMTETPYELAKNLISRGNIWNDTCFEVMIGGQRVAWGSRYNELARHFLGVAVHATGAVLQIASTGTMVKKPPTPRLRFHFVHIGDEAKRVSIQLAEDFRKARVPLTQHIGVESLTSQLALSESINSPYLLIMGRKEAIEGSAILRNLATQAETILPLLGIVDRLKAVA